MSLVVFEIFAILDRMDLERADGSCKDLCLVWFGWNEILISNRNLSCVVSICRNLEKPLVNLKRDMAHVKVKREKRKMKIEKLNMKREKPHVSMKREKPHVVMKQEKSHAKQLKREEPHVKREKYLLKCKKPRVKREKNGPFRQFYPQFGKSLTNAEHIAALLIFNESLAPSSPVESLGREFEGNFCRILAEKGRTPRAIHIELEAVRDTFSSRRCKEQVLKQYLKYMKNKP